MEATSDRYFESACRHLAFVFITVDEQLRVQFWNEAATRQFERTADQMRGREILEILPEDQRATVQESISRAITTGEAADIEIKLPGAEHSVALVMIVSPIVDEQGRAIGASLGMRDITERKRLSQEIARTRRMAALGRVAGSVAHHFNNIFGGISIKIDTVLGSNSPMEMRRALRGLAESIGQAARITNQLAAFAESENTTYAMVELNPLLTKFIEELRRRAKPLRIEIVTNIDDVASQPFEATRLMPVLESISQNAIDAMPSGGTLTIEMRRLGDDAEIAIRDTGVGMSPEMLERLFEPFFTTKTGEEVSSGKKIGLGLAAVHGLVSEMGGTISIQSKEGMGTTVRLLLPLKGSPGMDLEPTGQKPS